MKLLEATGLSVRFGETVILSEINFSMNAGELVGLIGPNGAGKTTLLRALSGLLPSNSDKLSFLSQPLSAISRKQLARDLAYLPQGNESHWAVTVDTLVMLGRLPHRNPWKGPSKKDRDTVQRALQACDVSQFAGRSVNTLSGGERARVMLARALAVEPRLLLADEPVTGFDPGHQLDVMERFRQLSDSGMGIAIVVHDLTLAARYCHRLVLLSEHKVIAQGKPCAVLSADNLARCFKIRAHIGTTEGHAFVVPIERCLRFNSTIG